MYCSIWLLLCQLLLLWPSTTGNNSNCPLSIISDYHAVAPRSITWEINHTMFNRFSCIFFTLLNLKLLLKTELTAPSFIHRVSSHRCPTPLDCSMSITCTVIGALCLIFSCNMWHIRISPSLFCFYIVYCGEQITESVGLGFVVVYVWT